MKTPIIITEEHIKATGEVFRRPSAKWFAGVCNKALEIAMAELDKELAENFDFVPQEQYITAAQARALGAGNAEWLNPFTKNWLLCSADSCAYRDTMSSDGVTKINYRAVRKEVPTVLRSDFDFVMQDKQRAVKLIEETYELICKGKTIQAQELLEKRVNNLTVNIPPFIETAEPHADIKANLVKLDGVLMTREAAVAIWESKKDACDVWYGNFRGHFSKTTDADFQPNSSKYESEYQIRPKAMKPVRWQDMPVGVALTFYGNRCLLLGASETKALISSKDGLCATGIDLKIAFDEKALTLAPADQQPWIAADLEAFKHAQGIEYQFLVVPTADKYPPPVVFKVIGIAEGYKLEGSK